MALPKTQTVLQMLVNCYGKDHVLPMAYRKSTDKPNVELWLPIA
jgi:hypothetical protein